MQKVDLAVAIFAVMFIGLCFLVYILMIYRLLLNYLEQNLIYYGIKYCICRLAYFIISDYCPKQTPE